MKFYGTGGTIVWDKENDKALCQFVDGEFETDDKRIIDLLIKAGYRSDDVGRETEQGNEEGQEVEAEQAEEDEGIDFEEMTYNELKSLAKAEGVTVGHKNKADLIIALKEGE